MLFEMRWYDILVVYSIMYMCNGNYFVLFIVDPDFIVVDSMLEGLGKHLELSTCPISEAVLT